MNYILKFRGGQAMNPEMDELYFRIENLIPMLDCFVILEVAESTHSTPSGCVFLQTLLEADETGCVRYLIEAQFTDDGKSNGHKGLVGARQYEHYTDNLDEVLNLFRNYYLDDIAPDIGTWNEITEQIKASAQNEENPV
jgi:hypothetical protein